MLVANMSKEKWVSLFLGRTLLHPHPVIRIELWVNCHK